MAELKTIRLKKLENLKEFGEVEGRTYYVEENNTLYRDVLSRKMAVGQVYFIPNGISKRDNDKTLSNVLVISNEIINQEDVDENGADAQRSYVVGMYDENGKYIDLSAGFGVGTVHTYKIDDVIGLKAALEGKAAKSHKHLFEDITDVDLVDVIDITDITIDQEKVDGLLAALEGKAAKSHKHLFTEITGVAEVNQIPELPLDKIEDIDLVDVIDIADITIDQEKVDGLPEALEGKAARLHTHLFEDITDVAKVDQIPELPFSKLAITQENLTGTISLGDTQVIKGINSSLEGLQENLDTHKHNASDITLGTLPVARGGTGKTSFALDEVLIGNNKNPIKTAPTALIQEWAMKPELDLEDVPDLPISKIENLEIRLQDIEGIAETNVQSDWAETDTTADSYIKNKPEEINLADIVDDIPYIQTLASDVSDNTASINAHTNEISTLNDGLDTLEGNLSSLDTRVESNTDNISTINSEIDGINNTLQNKSDKVHKHKSSDITDAVNIDSVPLTTLNGDLPISRIIDLEAQLNSKQDSIGYTPENTANKRTSIRLSGANDTSYVSELGVKKYVDGLIGSVYRPAGDWNAATNSPTLVNNTPANSGKVYRVSVAGTRFGFTFAVGDKIAFDESGVISKWDNVDDVVSVNGQTGKVVLTTDDINEGSNLYVSQAEKDKLEYIEENAQVNKIESISLGSRELTISDKNVSIPTIPIHAWAMEEDKPSYNLDQISDGTNYKRVTQSEKNTWNAKQSALGFTPENITNKKTSWSDNVNHTNYPSEKLVKDSLDSKVDKEVNKGLSTNDFTTTEKNKLSGIQTGAQVNKIESISLGSEALTISGKSVSIPTTPISAWAMKSSLAIGDIPTGTTGTTVALGNHTHSQYLTSFTETDPTVPSHVKSITSANISSWNSKQNALGFTPENVANKKASWSSTVSDTNYPSEKLVKVSLDSKVDKVTGKGLSTNDFTTTEKNKLAGIEAGAQVNPYSKTQLDNKFNDKVDKVSGKQLSTNDYTTTEKNKLAGIEANAQVNTIESISLDSAVLTPSNKSVSIPTTPIQEWAMAENKPSYNLGEIAETATLKRFTQALKTKLDNIEAGAQVNVGTNLSQGARSTTTLRIDSSTGNNYTLPAATTSLAGLMTSADKSKLNGIATGAQKNVQSDWSATSGDAFIKNKPDVVVLADVAVNPTNSKIVKRWPDGSASATSFKTGSAEIKYNNTTKSIDFIFS